MSRLPGAKGEWIRGVLAEHEAALLRYALRLTGDPQKTQDVVQETFLRLCQADRSEVDGHVGPWLFRVCRQRVLDLHRKEQRMPIAESGAVNGCPSPTVAPDQQCQANEEARAVLAALAALSADQQEVVRLKFGQGMSYRDIGAVTGHTVSNVGVLLHTAIKKIRESFDAKETEGAAARHDT
ncbi:MAG TPA: sigma-70 family RNA polymerase sigma factor [Pirellulales bacterium]|jgi:RNA polymerase sigma-70 factor (ECF subfamily)